MRCLLHVERGPFAMSVELRRAVTTDRPAGFDLAGRRALVTGGSRGIGRAIVTRLARAGAKVAFTHAGDAEGAEATVAEADGGHCVALPLANGTPDAPARMVDAATRAFGGVDVLVLNAWLDVRQSIFELDSADIDRQLQVNLLDNLAIATRCAPVMRERGWGRLLFIGSINQVTPLPALPMYAALKCAMGSLMRSLAIELAEDGVTANSLLPGLVETDRNAHRRAPGGDWAWHSTHSNYMKRAATPDEIACFALFLCSDAGSFCTGSEYLVDGGAHIPGKFNWQQQTRRTGS